MLRAIALGSLGVHLLPSCGRTGLVMAAPCAHEGATVARANDRGDNPNTGGRGFWSDGEVPDAWRECEKACGSGTKTCCDGAWSSWEVAYLIALIFPAAALALEGLGHAGSERRRAAVGALLAGTLLTTTAWGAIPPRRHFHAAYGDVDFAPPRERDTKKAAQLTELAALVPPRASLAVSEHELPHVSGRTKCFDLKDDFFNADFILYERESGSDGAVQARRALATGDYEHVADRGSIVLLRNKNYRLPSNWQAALAESP